MAAWHLSSAINRSGWRGIYRPAFIPYSATPRRLTSYGVAVKIRSRILAVMVAVSAWQACRDFETRVSVDRLDFAAVFVIFELNQRNRQPSGNRPAKITSSNLHRKQRLRNCGVEYCDFDCVSRYFECR
ncbi:MAG: hypothetical protein WAO83_20690 [Fuerstiella sp.]